MNSSAAPTPTLGNLVPYLFYDDIEAMLDWYARVFSFVEIKRWEEEGRIHNAEMSVGDTELWMDGATGKPDGGDGHPQWIGVWVDDVDAMYAVVQRAGVDAPPPEDKPYGVRMLTVKDPEGYSWGFMHRIPLPR